MRKLGIVAVWVFCVAVFMLPVVSASGEEITELTIENPNPPPTASSVVYYTFEIIDPDKTSSQGGITVFNFRITNLPTSDTNLYMENAYIEFGPSGLPSAYYDIYYWLIDWSAVSAIPPGGTYEGPFFSIDWSNAVPIGYVQDGSMKVLVEYGDPPWSPPVPYSVTIVAPDGVPEFLGLPIITSVATCMYVFIRKRLGKRKD